MRQRKTLPLVVVLTLALVGTLAVSASILLVALNQVYMAQLEVGLESDAKRQSDYLKVTFSRMLWNFDLAQAQAVASAVARNESVLGIAVTTEDGRKVYSETKPGEALVKIESELSYEGSAVGTLSVTMSAAPLEKQREAVSSVAALSLVALLVLLAIMAPILLNLTILRPFNRLSKALVNDTGDGPFPYLPEPSSQISEVRTLESALATLNKAVARQVDELESRVRERTRELEEARALLVRTETLATLGQLAAGIAHELNTPLGAISSSVRMLQTDWANSLLPLLAKQVRLPVTGEAETFLRELTELAGNLEDYPDASSRRALKKRWVELGRDPEATTFDLVSSTGLWRRLDELAAWPEDPELNRILAVTLQWVRSLSIISSATEKSAAVVSALRTQVQPGAETEHKPLELKREIDHAMALLQNKIKNGIQVEVSAPSPVWVLGDATSLSKVWLNLVLNAIQAMDGSGQLEIQVSRTGAWGLVTVTDSGPGIPSEILHRVFEPFFTTKSTGMGLGLEIARKMVEQNHGRLDVESRSGRTTFSVQLPVFEHEEP